MSPIPPVPSLPLCNFLDLLPHPDVAKFVQGEDKVYVLRIIHGVRDSQLTVDLFRNKPVGGSYRGTAAIFNRLKVLFVGLQRSKVACTVASSDQEALLSR